MGASQAKPQSPGYYPVPPTPSPPATSGSMFKGAIPMVLGAIILMYVGLQIYNYFQRQAGKDEIVLFGTQASSGDQTPLPVDGKTRTVLSADSSPIGEGGDYGVQFWMYIKDWDYKFGEEKNILKRVSPDSGDVNPHISLHPSDNTLRVTVNVFPTGTGTDTFTCAVENVPIQTWFSVSVTTFQRNLDVYLNGRLVKSCVLPGVPKAAVGDIILNDAGGFSGSICNVHTYATMLRPEDTKSFFDAGTTCGTPEPTTSESSPLMTLFGYTFRISVLNDVGSEIRKFTF